MFEAYVTNLGLYPERGAGAGEYLKFPTTVEEVQALFSRIGNEQLQFRLGRSRFHTRGSKTCRYPLILSDISCSRKIA